MTPDQELGQFDLSPAFARQLLDENNQAVDVTGKTVLFEVRTPGCCAGKKIETPATIVDARGGYVSHDWQARETETPGVMYVWVIVTAPNEEPRAYPTWGLWTVRVLPQLR